jgi:carbonic anhydrase/acetyltransferase-like protein (isoleucine patch superfamily)
MGDKGVDSGTGVFCGKAPVISGSAYVDATARVIGDVTVEDDASIWPMAVVRADSASITIGRRSAILDLCFLEAPEGYPVVIEEETVISHGAIVHGAHVCRRTLVGIGAIILDGASISSGSIIGAGSLVTAGARIPPNSLVMGTPGKRLRETTALERETIARQVEELYRKSRQYHR